LRDVFDDVEAALRSGVRREAVLSALHQQGFKMTLESFKSALQRIRKERAKAGIAAPIRTPAAAPVPAPLPQGATASEPLVSTDPTSTTGNEAVRDALTNQQSREEKFAKYGSSSNTLSKRLGQKKES
jgi:hypothetical protein